MLTRQQYGILADAILAETNPQVVDAIAIGDRVTVNKWINSPSNVEAWNPEVDRLDLFKVTSPTVFITLDRGLQELWLIFMSIASERTLDFRSKRIRDRVEEIWGTTNTAVVLAGCTRKATRGELYIGGNTVTTASVSALRLTVYGNIPRLKMSQALNAKGAI